MKLIVVIVTIVLVCVSGFYFLFGDSAEVYEYFYSSPTTIRIEQDTIDLGTVRYGEKKQIAFHIRNTGDVPLLIRDVRPSCGCTNAQWKKQPVKPGEEVEISITFEPNSLGQFMKSVDVLCNTLQQFSKLNIIGYVVQ